MIYVRVEWLRDSADDPVLYLSEIGEDRYEVRKVQVYADGTGEWADHEHETDTVGLSEIAFSSLKEISEQAEFRAQVIDFEEFEQVWNAVRVDGRMP
ncbi:DUF6881 domain-containing protein [Umezawaea beigongshangensis]|uniref:DUF6881 domain-containing protein n=1 Tax=Umezawaea beigongshangensis TaxID=2780383 RepID=UPI0018F20D3F|nr:hypothetical protein [Umezawaea beigongshangensis]